jgi:hypothetical protein
MPRHRQREFLRFLRLIDQQTSDALEGTAADAFAGDLGEEAFDHVEPGRRGRSEVQMEARMYLEPALHGRGLVSGIVINDEMEIETGGGSAGRSA